MKKSLPRSSPKAMVRGFTIHDLPEIERPRQKLIQKGPQNLKDEEIYESK
jgi:hypothetical protein